MPMGMKYENEWINIMSYYDDEKNVEQYIKMAEGYDGQLLINILRLM